MRPEHGSLFEPLTVKGVALPNRIVVPPMVALRDLASEDGVEWYGQFAEGGAGLVIVEATRIHRFGRDFTSENLKPLVDAVHSEKVPIAIQLFMEPVEGRDNPTKLTSDDIEKGIEQFAQAAAICEEAGFDGVEPHGAHGFLLNQFFSAQHNQRTDEYGGRLENRMRMGLAVVQAVRERISDDVILLYRHTPVQPEGYALDDSLSFAARLVEAGVDVLDLSPSSDQKPGDLAAPFRETLRVPAITVGCMDEDERGVEALREGRADLIAIGRALIADPDWPNKVREERFDEIIKCVRCDEGCFGNQGRGEPVECTQH